MILLGHQHISLIPDLGTATFLMYLIHMVLHGACRAVLWAELERWDEAGSHLRLRCLGRGG